MIQDTLLTIIARLNAEQLSLPINPLDPHSAGSGPAPTGGSGHGSVSSPSTGSSARRQPIVAGGTFPDSPCIPNATPQRQRTGANDGIQPEQASGESAERHGTMGASSAGNDPSWVVVGADADSKDPRWQEFFVEFFIESSLEGSDDLLFFVRENHDGSLGYNASEFLSGPSGATGEYDPIFVRRKTGTQLPSLTDVIDWKQTFFLNLIIQLPCLLTASVCKKIAVPILGSIHEQSSSTRHSISSSKSVELSTPTTQTSTTGTSQNNSNTNKNDTQSIIDSPVPDFGDTLRDSPVTSTPSGRPSQQAKPKTRKSKMIALKRIMKKVYSAPYKSRMDVKDAFMNECSFPHVYYTVNDYEADDLQMTITEGEYLCAELSVLLPTDKKEIAEKVQQLLHPSELKDEENQVLDLQGVNDNDDILTEKPVEVPTRRESNAGVMTPVTHLDFDGHNIVIPETDVSPFPCPKGSTKIVLFQGAVPFSMLVNYYMDKEAFLDDKSGLASNYSITGYGRKLSSSANYAIASLSNNLRSGNFNTSALAHDVWNKFYKGMQNANPGDNNQQLDEYGNPKIGYYDMEGRTEYIVMRGPKGKGQCQVAIKDEAVFEKQAQEAKERKQAQEKLKQEQELQLQKQQEQQEQLEVEGGPSIEQRDNSSDGPSGDPSMAGNTGDYYSLFKSLGGQIKDQLINAKSTVFAYSAYNEQQSLERQQFEQLQQRQQYEQQRQLEQEEYMKYQQKMTQPQKPKTLRLSMTYINVPWQSIVTDLSNFYGKFFQ